MPRISSEARSAAVYRAGAKPPKAPSWLSRRAREHWKEIVRSKPLDWFDPGSLGILARYCTTLAYCEVLERRLGEMDASPEQIAADMDDHRKTGRALTGLATKLRLSVQANVEWHSRKIGEKGEAPKEAAGLRLIGGKALA